MLDTPDREVKDQIAAARTRLILDKPFLGALVLRLELQNADPDWCPTTGTDARNFYYHAQYIDSLNSSELQFVLAHEALHCALSHFARRQHRVKHRWDLACDYAINPILLDEGLNPPPGVVVIEEYRNMSAEEIYPLLKDNDLSETMDQHLYDKPDEPKEGGQNKQNNPLEQKNSKPEQNSEDPLSDEPQKGNNGQQNTNPGQSLGADTELEQDHNPERDGPLKAPPAALTSQEIEHLQEKWQQRLAGAAQQAKQAGKMSAALARFINTELAPALPWRQLLATYLSSTARDDYSYARPNTRRGDPAIYPRLRSSEVNAVIAVDVSGSISDRELNECITEINAIKGQLRATVSVLAVDDKISKGYPKTFNAWEEIKLSGVIHGGGGTDFTPVFDWMDAQDVAADILVYFTDGQGKFPKHTPSYPVIWLIKGKTKVPFGERIQLN